MISRNILAIFVTVLLCSFLYYVGQDYLHNSQQIKISSREARLLSARLGGILSNSSAKRHVISVKTKVHQPRILCWVFAMPGKKLTVNAQAIQKTWAKRCDKMLFFTTEKNFTAFETVTIEEPKEIANKVKGRIKIAWEYVYEHHYSDADFFFKAEIETYAIIENMKEFLSRFDRSKPEYFGHQMRLKGEDFIYMFGGLVLSREALKRLVIDSFQKNPSCLREKDKIMGNSRIMGIEPHICWCLTKAGCRPVNTTDEQGRERFMAFKPADLTFPSTIPLWFFDDDVNHARHGMPGCCSEYPIVFNGANKNLMPVLDYIFYVSKRHEDYIV